MVKLSSFEQKSIMNEQALKDIKEKYLSKSEEYEKISKEFNDRK